MDELLFKKVEVWAVGLVVVVGTAVAILFGALVREVALGSESFGFLGAAAHAVARVPSDLAQLLEEDSGGMTVRQGDRFEGRGGWRLEGTGASGPPDGYLLFSRYDGDTENHIVEVVDLATGRVSYRVDLDADDLLDGASREGLVEPDRWTTRRFRAIHPVPLDGDLLIKDHRTPLMRVDACGGLVWRLGDDLYHHSTEADPEGMLWIPTTARSVELEGLPEGFFDNGIARVSPEGEVLYRRSLTRIMLDHGFGGLLFPGDGYRKDPMHLNDIQPVPSDGPFWRAGDVFLSLRHLSMVLLFRPSSDEIVWMKQGPWAGQHDVDIVDDHTIAIFDNNMLRMEDGPVVDGTSEVLLYDFETDEVTSPWADVFRDHDVRTESQGLFTLLPDGHLYVEESDAGRTLVFGPDGELVVEHVNRATDGRVYRLGWSRFLERAEGDAFLEAARGRDCG